MFILYFLLMVAGLVGLAALVDRAQGMPVKRPLLKLAAFITTNYKSFGLLAMLGVWYAIPAVAEFFTPKGGQPPATMDGGVFQTLPLATIRGLAIYLFVKLFLNREVSVVYNYFTSGSFGRDFRNLTPWQKQILTVCWLLGCCFLFSQLTR